MHSLNTKTVVPSKKYPGVEFTVRTLNVVQRAKRDSKVAVQRAEFSRLIGERDALLETLIGKGGDPEEREKKYEALPPADLARYQVANQAVDQVLQMHLVPSAIEAALISISGYEIDGQVPDVATLIENAPDDLLTEIYNACTNASGLSGDEAKN